MALAKPQSLFRLYCVLCRAIPFPLHFSTKAFSLCSSSPTANTIDITSSSPPFMVSFLVDIVGLPKESAIAASSKLLHLKTPEKLISVLDFLKANGFQETHIHNIIRKRPLILATDVDKTLKPKFKFFQDLGLSGSDLGGFLSKNPGILSYSTEKRAIPNIDFIKKYLHSNENILSVLKCNSAFGYDVDKRMLPNIKFMESQGVEGSNLTELLLSKPRLLDQNPGRLKQITEKVKELGIDPGSKMYRHVLGIMSSMSNGTWQRKIEFFKTFGWSEEDILTAFRKLPVVVALSVEKLQKAMAYLVKELKFDKNYLVLHPHLLTFSLEGRVIPRHNLLTVLRSRKLLKMDVSLSTVCLLSEKVFLERYVLRFGGESENLLKIYKESKENSRIIDQFRHLYQAS
ncbi:hypothetical protein AMTRI_Chr04g251010 [Amborella trichopoda]